MNATRLFSVAAVAAFASFGAQAGSAYGDLYGANFDASVQSTRASVEVRAEGAASLPAQKNFVVLQANQPSQLSRLDVRAEAVTAARAGEIATGNRS